MSNAGIVAELFERGESFMGWQVWDRDDAFLDQIRDAGLASEDGELWRAVWDNDFKRMQVLLDEGANPNAIATINCHGAKKYFEDNNIADLPNRKEIDFRTVSYDASVSVLMYAAARCTPEVASILVSSGADVNFVGVGRQTPLHFMLDIRRAFGDEEKASCTRIAETLINAGASINRVDDHGDTALIAAAESVQEDIVKLLVEKGADVNWRGMGNVTALMNAANWQCPNMIRFLVDHGADTEIKRRRDGYTAFLVAAFRPLKSCVNALIEKGANIFATDNQGWSALDILEYRDECVTASNNGSSIDWLFWVNDKNDVVDLLAEKGVRYKFYTYKNANLEEKFAPKLEYEPVSRKPQQQKPPASTNSSTQNSGSGGCYVATAVYGSYDCPQVWTLRRFRDYQLSSTLRGRTFIRAYYAISPFLVKHFGGTAWFKRICQKKLDALVARCHTMGFSDLPYEDRFW